MELSSEALETICNYVRRDIELRERTVRAEEELKAQREQMRQEVAQLASRLDHIDKRFEDMNQYMRRWFTVTAFAVMAAIFVVATTVGLFVR